MFKVLSVAFPATPNSEMLLFNLDIMGVSCSGGSACSSGSVGGSHVLNAISVDAQKPGVRFSFSKYNTIEEIDFTIGKLNEIFN